MPLIRKSAAEAPASQINAENVRGAISGGTSDERWAAARTASTLPDGLALLQDALAEEKDPRVREALFTSLARLHTPESAEVILPYLRSDDSEFRTGALDALKAMPKAIARHLPGLLRDADSDVRLLACELVRNQPVPDATRLLDDLLSHDNEANVCAAAIEVLAEIGGEDCLPILARCLARFPKDPFLEFAIKAASDRIGTLPRA